MQWCKFSNEEKRDIENDVNFYTENVAESTDVYTFIPNGKKVALKMYDQKLVFVDLVKKKFLFGFKFFAKNKFGTVYCFGTKTYFRRHLMFCCHHGDLTDVIPFLYQMGSVRTILFSVPFMTLEYTNFIPYPCKYVHIGGSIVERKHLLNFWLSVDSKMPDTYFLYNRKSDVMPLGIAYIPDYTTSHMMNICFSRSDVDHQTLDFLEESDDESEDDTKYGKQLFLCQFDSNFKKWIPLKKIK